jgi:hypothetical protein
MVLFRRYAALVATLLLAATGLLAAEEPPLTAATIIAKARAALAADPVDLMKVKSLQMVFTAFDEQNRPLNATTLTLAAGGYRLQSTTDRDRGFEAAVCAGRLEGWTSTKADALSPRSVRPVPYEEFKKLRDMAVDDLAFFAAPPAGVGTATYRGPSVIAGRKTLAVEYGYESGLRITRHFDAASFALVASDQATPKGELQRQQVESLTKVDGISFPAKETIYVDGKKSGEVTYDQVKVNPALTPGLFDFPSF